jgi:TetR/AcrR family transcriptional repressor of nem operon
MASKTPQPKRRGRTKTAEDQSETRRKLIRAGLVHLTEQGYRASSVDDILAAAGVPKGCLYHHFHSKADFAAALIEAYNTYFVAKLERHFQDPRLAALDRLRAFTRDAEAGMAKHGFTRGCLVGNLGQEIASVPEEFRTRLIEIFKDWQARTAHCLSDAQAEGDIAPKLPPATLAAFFWTGWEGAVLRAKMEQSAAPLRRFTDTFFALLTT